MTKDRAYKCPKCGEDVMISCEDYICDMDSAVWFYSCDKCGAGWAEHFDLVYTGYRYDFKSYDCNGAEK